MLPTRHSAPLFAAKAFQGLLFGIGLWGSVSLTGTGAGADTLLRYAHTDGEVSQILVKSPYARMDLHAPGTDGRGFLLFNANDGSLYLVNETAGTYLYFDERVLDAQITALATLLEQMRLQIGQLPFERRQELEMQLGFGLEHTPAPMVARVRAEFREVDGVRCRLTEILAGERVRTRVCAASPADLGVTPGGYETLKALTDRLFYLSQRALEAGGPMAKAVGYHVIPRVEGIPLEIHDLAQNNSTRLVGVTSEPLSPEFFRIPGSYRETAPF